MPAFIDETGFPFWGNPSPQKSSSIPGRQVNMMIEDIQVNQVFSGRADEIGIIQKVRPRQARIEGGGSDSILTVGAYGSTLYDDFMKPFDQDQKKGTP